MESLWWALWSLSEWLWNSVFKELRNINAEATTKTIRKPLNHPGLILTEMLSQSETSCRTFFCCLDNLSSFSVPASRNASKTTDYNAVYLNHPTACLIQHLNLSAPDYSLLVLSSHHTCNAFTINFTGRVKTSSKQEWMSQTLPSFCCHSKFTKHLDNKQIQLNKFHINLAVKQNFVK